MKLGAVVVALFGTTAHAFSPVAVARPARADSTTALNIVPGDSADVLAKINAILEEAAAPKVDPEFDQIVQSYFPGAIDNGSLENAVVDILSTKGFTAANTLLGTSLCCDELARRLEDDFVKIYGNNFALGGLAGFPFAGNTGFGAMAAHIPDDGYCLLVYGPHVGISKDGTVGKVERQGIALIDTCCGSAVAANNYLKSITDGGALMVADVQKFTDFQQGAVQQLILPHGKRLSDAENRMVELPLALFDSQDVLMQDIVQNGAGGTKAGLALLGGIQINTNPGVPDYFLPIRFDYMNNQGEILESLLPALTSMTSGAANITKASPEERIRELLNEYVALTRNQKATSPVTTTRTSSAQQQQQQSTATTDKTATSSSTTTTTTAKTSTLPTTRIPSRVPAPSTSSTTTSAASHTPIVVPKVSMSLTNAPVQPPAPKTATKSPPPISSVPASSPPAAAPPAPTSWTAPPPRKASAMTDDLRRKVNFTPRQTTPHHVNVPPPPPPPPPPTAPKRQRSSLADELRKRMQYDESLQSLAAKVLRPDQSRVTRQDNPPSSTSYARNIPNNPATSRRGRVSPDIVPGVDAAQRKPAQPEPKSSLRPDDNLSRGSFFTDDYQQVPVKRFPKRAFVRQPTTPQGSLDGEARRDYYDNTWATDPDLGDRVLPPFDPTSDPDWGTQAPKDDRNTIPTPDFREPPRESTDSPFWGLQEPPSVPGWEWNTQTAKESRNTKSPRDPFDSKEAPSVPGWEWNTQTAKGDKTTREPTTGSIWKSSQTQNVPGAVWNTQQPKEPRYTTLRNPRDPYYDPYFDPRFGDPYEPNFGDPFWDTDVPPNYPPNMPREPRDARYVPPFYPSDGRVDRFDPIRKPAKANQPPVPPKAPQNPPPSPPPHHAAAAAASSTSFPSANTPPARNMSPPPTPPPPPPPPPRSTATPRPVSPVPPPPKHYSFETTRMNTPTQRGRVSTENKQTPPDKPASSMGPVIPTGEKRKSGRVSKPTASVRVPDDDDSGDNPIARAVAGGRII